MNGDEFSVDLGPIIDARVEEIAQRTAEIVLAQLDQRQAEQRPEWLRLPTASDYIDLTEHALRKRAERGEIAYSQDGPGCSMWFARADLDRFMLDQRVEARRSR